MKFYIRLKQLRQKKKLTQGELAAVLGMKPTAISNYEANRNEPSFEKLIALADYFDVSSDYLLGISDAYIPISGEVLDRDMIELFNLYQQLTPENTNSLRTYAKFLYSCQEGKKA